MYIYFVQRNRSNENIYTQSIKSAVSTHRRPAAASGVNFYSELKIHCPDPIDLKGEIDAC
jgi:hypothetical protein